ncbi:Gfo/Idh/MocA family oxidoreductase [Leptospira adleri]|uniref:Oxidoreductase n=1 Tax=Leptospira adleri TaxID=2023186 RepID=A0ABX4NYB9_9LEPT|nr:Gfo/Idh/MocA family oxidoreductase [Leptospira adleri]PJZ61805.1 oxidoreductase [Leptospira adleri]
MGNVSYTDVGAHAGSSYFPRKVSLIGGGRWARIIAEVLITQVSPSVELTIHSIHNAKELSAWVSKFDSEKRIKVESVWPELTNESCSAVIIANAARDHAKAIEFALSSEIPVLVEKPLTLSSESSRRLIDLARIQGTRFAASHVFLYARYIENFAKLVTKEGELLSLQFDWIDPKSEIRYGEFKKYDSLLPIYADILPHIISIFDYLLPNLEQSCKSLVFSRGGARLELEIIVGNVPCKIYLERNGASRTRSIEVKTTKQVFKLDFSQEPGFISTESQIIPGDFNWEVGKRPIASMLTAFLNWAAGGQYDNRLSVELGLKSNQMIDQVSEFYDIAMLDWLKSILVNPTYSIEDDVLYAFAEILNIDKANSSEMEIKRKLDQIRESLLNTADVSLSQLLGKIKTRQ